MDSPRKGMAEFIADALRLIAPDECRVCRRKTDILAVEVPGAPMKAGPLCYEHLIQLVNFAAMLGFTTANAITRVKVDHIEMNIVLSEGGE